MGNYPRGAAARAERRRHILERELAEAQVRAVRTGRSLKCSGDGGVRVQHAGEWGGCKNSGTTCLCECHDVPD